MKLKRGLIWNEIGYWIIALSLLALLIMGFIFLKSGGSKILEGIINKIRFGR